MESKELRLESGEWRVWCFVIYARPIINAIMMECIESRLSSSILSQGEEWSHSQTTTSLFMHAMQHPKGTKHPQHPHHTSYHTKLTACLLMRTVSLLLCRLTLTSKWACVRFTKSQIVSTHTKPCPVERKDWLAFQIEIITIGFQPGMKIKTWRLTNREQLR